MAGLGVGGEEDCVAGTGPLTPSLGCLSSASAEFTTNCWSGRRGDVTLALQHGHAEVGFKDASHVSCGVCTQGGSLHGLRPQTPWHPGTLACLAGAQGVRTESFFPVSTHHL